MSEKVILDGFVFDLGPKRQIDVSNPRNIAKIDVPGKSPDYQDMGEDEHTIGWAGVLIGEDALDNIQKLEKIKEKGLEVKFLKGKLSKTVRIRDIPYSIVNDERVEYSISLIIIQKDITEVVVKPTTVIQIDQVPGSGKSPTTKVSSSTSIPALVADYTVKSGDTLWKIAQAYLGNGDQWPKLADKNGISNPRSLKVGAKIKITTA